MKTLKIALVCILIMVTVVSIAGASKESTQSSMNTLKDQVNAIGSASSDGYSYVSASAIAGDNSEATVYAGGEGSWLSTISSIYMETDNPVEGTGDAYVSGDDVSSGAESIATSGDDFGISITTFIEGIGNAEGYTCVYGWERSC